MYAAKIDEAVKMPEAPVEELDKLTPPASLKESHEYSVKAFREFIDLYRRSAAAARAENFDAYVDIEG